MNKIKGRGLSLLSLIQLIVIQSIVVPTSVSATECQKLPPLICLSSVKCTLDCERVPGDRRRCVPGAGYFCRRERGECEQASDQATMTKEGCERSGRCRFEPAFCFCSCDFDDRCDCECGGGPPNSCVERSE